MGVYMWMWHSGQSSALLVQFKNESIEDKNKKTYNIAIWTMRTFDIFVTRSALRLFQAKLKSVLSFYI